MSSLSNNHRHIALVIGSGSVRCAAAIGAYQVLQREKIPIDLVVGCSGGAMYASLIALGYDSERIQTMTLELWTGDVMAGYASNLKAAMAGEVEFNEHSGLVDDKVLNERLHKAFDGLTFEQSPVPLHLVATDIRNGEEVVLSQGNIFDAVRASIAIPLIFPPHEVNGRLLIDGAASDPLPVDVAIKEGADTILAMGFDLPYRARLRSLNAVQNQLNSVYMNNILHASFAFHNLAHHAELIPLLPEIEQKVANFDTHSFPIIIQSGVKVMEEQLPYLIRLMDE